MKNIIKYSLLVVGIWSLVITAGFAWSISKDLEQEIQVKKDALKADPANPDKIFDLAITYSYTNHIEEGLALLKKIEQNDPSYKDEAYVTYTNKVTASPSDWKLRFRLAFALYFAGKKTDAIRELRNVLIIDPNNVWAYGYIALIYGEMGDIDKAMAAAKSGLKIDTNVAALHLLLAQGYYKKGDSWSGFVEAANALRLKAQGF